MRYTVLPERGATRIRVARYKMPPFFVGFHRIGHPLGMSALIRVYIALIMCKGIVYRLPIRGVRLSHGVKIEFFLM